MSKTVWAKSSLILMMAFVLRCGSDNSVSSSQLNTALHTESKRTVSVTVQTGVQGSPPSASSNVSFTVQERWHLTNATDFAVSGSFEITFSELHIDDSSVNYAQIVIYDFNFLNASGAVIDNAPLLRRVDLGLGQTQTIQENFDLETNSVEKANTIASAQAAFQAF